MSRSTSLARRVRSLLVGLGTAGLLAAGSLAAPSAWAANPPAVSSLDPASARPGAAVTVHGSALSATSAVTLNSETAPFTVVDDSTVRFTVPMDATTGPVTVTTPDGSATSPGPLTVLTPPAPVTGLSARPGESAVELSWSGGGTAGVVVRSLPGPVPPAGPTDGTQVFQGVATVFRDTGLTDGAAVSYAVWSADTDGTLSRTAATVTATPAAPAPAVATLQAVPLIDPAGEAVTLTGHLAQPGGAALAAAPVELLAQPLNAPAPAVLATGVTAGDGSVAFQATPRLDTGYWLRYPGDAFDAPVMSPGAGVQVQPRLTAALTPSSILLGGSTVLHGTLTPAYAGVRLVLQRRLADGWHSVQAFGTGAGGSYSLNIRPGVTGRPVLRVLLPGSSLYRAAGSPAVALQVDARNLSLGETGGDVLALEQRLSGLRYDPGAVDGVFDDDTLHAVIAFQKAAGLPRSGVYDALTRSALGAASVVPARFSSLGLAVEVNLAKQLLVVSQAGQTVRVYDVSSGGGYFYTSEGVTSQAITPQGRFWVQSMIDGWHTSPLGLMYRPAFFYRGFAVHGDTLVPPYPASHGCIRVTLHAMDWLFPLLSIGTPVTVYPS